MATMRDVAQAAGVTVSTVSHVLNQTAPVSDATREKVLKAIDQLGYRRNRQRKRKTRLVGIIHEVISERNTSLIVGAIEYFQSQGVRVLMATCDTPLSDVKSLDTLVRELGLKDVQGVLLMNRWVEKQTGLIAGNLPCVVVFAERSQLPSVIPDFFQGSRDATRHLISLGHKRILLLNGPLQYWSCREREEGYRAAHAEAGLEPVNELVSTGAWGTESGYQRMKAALARGLSFTAVFAGNDAIALGAIDALREEGLSVPDDVAVVGFDDSETARAMRPSLTSVQLPLRAIGQAAANLLLEQINRRQFHPAHGSTAESLQEAGGDHPAALDTPAPIARTSVLQIHCPLIVRGSCGAAKVSTPTTRR